MDANKMNIRNDIYVVCIVTYTIVRKFCM